MCVFTYVVLKNVMFNDKLPTTDLSFHVLDEQQCTYISDNIMFKYVFAKYTYIFHVTVLSMLESSKHILYEIHSLSYNSPHIMYDTIVFYSIFSFKIILIDRPLHVYIRINKVPVGAFIHMVHPDMILTKIWHSSYIKLAYFDMLSLRSVCIIRDIFSPTNHYAYIHI